MEHTEQKFTNIVETVFSRNLVNHIVQYLVDTIPVAVHSNPGPTDFLLAGNIWKGSKNGISFWKTK